MAFWQILILLLLTLVLRVEFALLLLMSIVATATTIWLYFGLFSVTFWISFLIIPVLTFCLAFPFLSGNLLTAKPWAQIAFEKDEEKQISHMRSKRFNIREDGENRLAICLKRDENANENESNYRRNIVQTATTLHQNASLPKKQSLLEGQISVTTDQPSAPLITKKEEVEEDQDFFLEGQKPIGGKVALTLFLLAYFTYLVLPLCNIEWGFIKVLHFVGSNKSIGIIEKNVTELALTSNWTDLHNVSGTIFPLIISFNPWQFLVMVLELVLTVLLLTCWLNWYSISLLSGLNLYYALLPVAFQGVPKLISMYQIPYFSVGVYALSAALSLPALILLGYLSAPNANCLEVAAENEQNYEEKWKQVWEEAAKKVASVKEKEQKVLRMEGFAIWQQEEGQLIIEID